MAMQLAATLPLTRRAERRRRPAAAPARQRSAESSAQARAQRAGGSQDRALYSCQCGYAFTAAVTTSVGCPQCGSHQAW